MGFKQAYSNATLERNKKPDLSKYTITTAVTRGSGLRLIFSDALRQRISEHYRDIKDKAVDVYYDKNLDRVKIIIHNWHTSLGEFKVNTATGQGYSDICSHSFYQLGMNSDTTYQAFSVVEGQYPENGSLEIIFQQAGIFVVRSVED